MQSKKEKFYGNFMFYLQTFLKDGYKMPGTVKRMQIRMQTW